jgi:nucleolar protein 56
MRMLKATLLGSIIGVHAFNEENEVIAEAHYPRDAKQIARALTRLRDGELTREAAEVLGQLRALGVEAVAVQNEALMASIEEEGFSANVEAMPAAGEYLRGNIQRMAVEAGFIDSVEQYGELSHAVNTEVARSEVHEALSERESLLMPTVQLLVEMDAVLNNLSGRMREWYGVHFPELGRRVEEHREYANIIKAFGDRSSITVKALQELSFKKKDAERITAAAEASMGAAFDPDDMARVQSFAENLLNLYKGRDELTEYISGLTEEIAANVAYLAGPVLGAKLIQKAGSLRRMAMMPSSTIQVLGAEKAMFRALKTNARPPKHGLLFQHPYVHGAPRGRRGNRARSLAAKIAIAARADVFSGDFIAEDLQRQLMEG